MKHAATILALAFLTTSIALSAALDDVSTLIAPDGTSVVIYRDHYGVPHIRAATEAALFYGQGYAAAEDRLFQMETFRRTGLGRLSEVGLASPATDRLIRATTYTAAERAAQFARLAPALQAMITSYVDGINAYLELVHRQPLRYRPAEFFAPQLNFSASDPKPWTSDDVLATIQFLMRRFGQSGGEELNRLAELTAHDFAWFNQNRPLNDPAAPTTIPDPSSGKATTAAPAAKSDAWQIDPEVPRKWTRLLAESGSELAAIGVPAKLGSFAAIVAPSKSQSGNVLLLGAPQLTPPALGQTNVTHEVELDAPSLHMAGMSIGGLPGVVIGHTEHHAWTLTSGNSDNTDTFIEILNADGTAYLHNGSFHAFEVIPEPDLAFARLRTVHGPVIMLDAANQRAYSWQFTFRDRELEMLEAFYQMWKATDLSGFESALQAVPMNFNVLYVGDDQNIKYFHVGSLLRNTQTLEEPIDPRLPRMGDGSQEWGADPFLAFDDLPQASQDVQSYFVNWNNKPSPAWNNGDNIAWSLVFRPERTTRVLKIENFIGPNPSVSFGDLKSIPLEIGDHGTYQQAVEFTPSFIRNENIVPPGQSGFISPTTGPSPHLSDQWALHELGAFKNMAFNERIRQWPPNHKFVSIDATAFVDRAPMDAFVETVWLDETPEGESGDPIQIGEDCKTVRLRAERDGSGNGRVYTLHVAAPDPVGKIGTAALFQVYVPKSDSPNHAFAVDDGPALTEAANCGSAENLALEPPVEALHLDQNQPNPFNPSTRISYRLPESGPVRLAVYNLLGQEVRLLVDHVQTAGSYSVQFDGAGLSTGVYFYTLRTGDTALTKMMILQK